MNYADYFSHLYLDRNAVCFVPPKVLLVYLCLASKQSFEH